MDEEEQLKLWTLKKTIKMLENAVGSGTSVVTLIIRPGDQVSKISSLLTNEYGTASNIKSRTNRQSVQSAIVCAQQRLKQYSKIPDTGLCIFCGTVLNEEEKPRILTIDIVPSKDLGTALYLCDSKFNVEPLKVLLKDDATWGFIIIDGSECLFATLSGSTKDIVQRNCVSLPRKHNKGGQSSGRFGRIRDEKRQNYVTKVSDDCSKIFITDDKPNVKGLIIAGSADFKDMLYKDERFDPRLKKIVVKIVDTSYGSYNGLNQAIDLSSDTLGSMKYIQEKNVVSNFFDHIAKDTGKVCFGLSETIKAFEEGLVEKLIIYEDIDIYRTVVKDETDENNTQCIKFLKLDEFKKWPCIVESENFIEWFGMSKDNRRGANIELISNKTQEGAQFIAGFGGIGGILRYKMETVSLQNDEWGSDDEWDSDY